MSEKRVKFATQMDEKILTDLRAFAKREGRQLQSVFEEAAADYLHEHDSSRPNPKIMAAAAQCIERYGPLLEKLAK